MALIYAGGLTDTSFTTGNSNAGYQHSAFAYGGHFVLGSGGTVTQFGVRGFTDTAVRAVKFGLYDASGNLIGSGTGSMDTTTAWYDSGTVSVSVPSAGTYYLLVSVEANDCGIYFSSADDGTFATEAYATFPADPESLTIGGDTGSLYAVRMDFSVGGGGFQAAWAAGSNQVLMG